MYIMRVIIFEEKAGQDQYPLSLSPAQKANDPIQDRNRSIWANINGFLTKVAMNFQTKKKCLFWHYENIEETSAWEDIV